LERCLPQQWLAACPGGDDDHDGVRNSDDDEPTDPCAPSGNALACPRGDTDDDGVDNDDDQEPIDPCRPDGDSVACPRGDTDGDGVDNERDVAPLDACRPTPDNDRCNRAAFPFAVSGGGALSSCTSARWTLEPWALLLLLRRPRPRGPSPRHTPRDADLRG
jgi:hypothetical protein